MIVVLGTLDSGKRSYSLINGRKQRVVLLRVEFKNLVLWDKEMNEPVQILTLIKPLAYEIVTVQGDLTRHWKNKMASPRTGSQLAGVENNPVPK